MLFSSTPSIGPEAMVSPHHGMETIWTIGAVRAFEVVRINTQPRSTVWRAEGKCEHFSLVGVIDPVEFIIDGVAEPEDLEAEMSTATVPDALVSTHLGALGSFPPLFDIDMKQAD